MLAVYEAKVNVETSWLFSVPVFVKMSSAKVVPTAESKSGKIYANTEQRRTLMAIYLTDNYPDTSILEQVTLETRLWSKTSSRKIKHFSAPGIQ